MTASAEITQLLLFTLLWTAVWVAPLPQLGRRAELIVGLIPFVAFGLRVFAGFFVGVPDDDPVRSVVRPLLDWINGQNGFPRYAWVLDGTVALGPQAGMMRARQPEEGEQHADAVEREQDWAQVHG